MFKLEFETDNSVFHKDGPHEVARILREIAADVLNGQTERRIRDLYGNTIGKWTYVQEDN